VVRKEPSEGKPAGTRQGAEPAPQSRDLKDVNGVNRDTDKGKKKAIRLPIGANEQRKQTLMVISGLEDPGVASAAQPVTTRRGRNIKVPNK
jgi:hypothetical protein